MHLDLWNSVAIVFGFSVLVIALDEYVAKPWRHKRWEERAQSGDKEAQELLKVARSAKVSNE
ncbi:MAG: hypothetical protein IT294_00050 [Deltaproteobacteria bacterium]|nr:hypothetical protein [Deltaproteobacteria bacterium]